MGIRNNTDSIYNSDIICRALLDTNIILDYVDIHRPEHESAKDLVITASASTTLHLYTSIGSYKDTYYILHRLYQNEQLARTAIERLIEDADIEPVDLLASYALSALKSNEPDFENALIATCAEWEKMDVIITRDEKAFVATSLPCMDARTFLLARKQ